MESMQLLKDYSRSSTTASKEDGRHRAWSCRVTFDSSLEYILRWHNRAIQSLFIDRTPSNYKVRMIVFPGVALFILGSGFA